MKKRSLLVGIVFMGIAGIAVLAVYTLVYFMPSDPLEGSDQLVLVLASTQHSKKAVMQVFTREETVWKFSFSCTAVIGKNGVAWGRGLHKNSDCPEGEPVKREGDGTSPEGVFPLIHAYGYLPPSMVRILFPYAQVTEDLICCDDIDSKYYAKIIDIRQKGLDPERLPSHEKMRRRDDLYKYAILVGHNTWRSVKGAGSCVFIHLWNDFNSSTSGCTAISEESMLTLLSELDPEKNPVMVLLTRKNYLRLKEEWGLPDVTI